MADKKLLYGDDIDILRRYIKDESVDFIYLDPPFNSRQDYNVLFAEKDGTQSSSQITDKCAACVSEVSFYSRVGHFLPAHRHNHSGSERTLT